MCMWNFSLNMLMEILHHIVYQSVKLDRVLNCTAGHPKPLRRHQRLLLRQPVCGRGLMQPLSTGTMTRYAAGKNAGHHSLGPPSAASTPAAARHLQETMVASWTSVRTLQMAVPRRLPDGWHAAAAACVLQSCRATVMFMALGDGGAE